MIIMRTEDLFKYGVTPKEGEYAGKRFIVDEINKTVVVCHSADNAICEKFPHGSYDIWREPKTLFEDSTIKPTWGNLKKAAEKAGISDDMEFAVRFSEFFDSHYKQASFEIKELYKSGGEKIKCILVQ